MPTDPIREQQELFIAKLRAVMSSHTPPFILDARSARAVILHWQEPDAAFVAFAAAVGPRLGEELWREMQELVIEPLHELEPAE